MRGNIRLISRLTLCCTTSRSVRPLARYQCEPHVVDIIHQDTTLPQAHPFQDVLQNLPQGQIGRYVSDWFCCRARLVKVFAEDIIHPRIWLRISTSWSPCTSRDYHNLLNNSHWPRFSLARAPLLAYQRAGEKVFWGMVEDEVDVMSIPPLLTVDCLHWLQPCRFTVDL